MYLPTPDPDRRPGITSCTAVYKACPICPYMVIVGSILKENELPPPPFLSRHIIYLQYSTLHIICFRFDISPTHPIRVWMNGNNSVLIPGHRNNCGILRICLAAGGRGGENCAAVRHSRLLRASRPRGQDTTQQYSEILAATRALWSLQAHVC